jgi:hypothetical protein
VFNEERASGVPASAELELPENITIVAKEFFASNISVKGHRFHRAVARSPWEI